MKTKIILPIALGLVLGAGACTRSADTEVHSASQAGAGEGNQTVELAEGGLTSGSRGLHHSNMIAFGQPRAQVEAQVRAAIGAPTGGGTNAECPTGPVEYLNFGALGLHFENGRFTGWVVDGPTANPEIQSYHGLSVGDRRSELDGDAEVQVDADSTLGTELSVDGIGALLDGPGPNARVTTLFAGTTCFAR